MRGIVAYPKEPVLAEDGINYCGDIDDALIARTCAIRIVQSWSMELERTWGIALTASELRVGWPVEVEKVVGAGVFVARGAEDVVGAVFTEGFAERGEISLAPRPFFLIWAAVAAEYVLECCVESCDAAGEVVPDFDLASVEDQILE